MQRPATYWRPAFVSSLLLQQVVQLLVRGLAAGIRLLLRLFGQLLLGLRLSRLRAKGFQPFHIDLRLLGLRRLRRGLLRLVRPMQGVQNRLAVFGID